MNLLPCPKCLRHARASEPACPFCKTPLPADFAARSPKGGMWRWHVVTAGAHEAPGYDILSTVIRVGCRAAIKISEKV